MHQESNPGPFDKPAECSAAWLSCSLDCGNMRQRKLFKLLFLASSLCALVLFWSFSYDGYISIFVRVDSNMTGFNCAKNITIKNRSDKKLLLFYQFPDYYELGKNTGFQIFNSCDKKCELTVDETRFQEADVVVFYSHRGLGKQKPPIKMPGQKWVFFTVESPVYSENADFGGYRWWNKFDWTMSYRYDSEFWHGYARTRPRPKPASKEVRLQDEVRWRQEFKNKTKMVAWFVSHCETDSLREKYAAQLSKYIPVDIYGQCGNLKCDDRQECLKMLDKYKFYLSFENSLCVDYVTEKLLNILQRNSLVPVVRGGADYESIFPQNSVINVKNFSSAEKLAEYLKELASNEDEYIKKLQWVWHHEVLGPDLPLCHLCQAIHSAGPVSCVYANVYQWWSHNACVKPRDVWGM